MSCPGREPPPSLPAMGTGVLSPRQEGPKRINDRSPLDSVQSKNKRSCKFIPPCGIMACTWTRLVSGIRKVQYLLCRTEQNISSKRKFRIGVTFSFDIDTRNNFNLINVMNHQLVLWNGINWNRRYNNTNTVPVRFSANFTEPPHRLKGGGCHTYLLTYLLHGAESFLRS